MRVTDNRSAQPLPSLPIPDPVASFLHTLRNDARLVIDNIADRAMNLTDPAIRLGVTGLSRAGKTVFISSLVHNLLNDGRIPVFEPIRSGRVSKVRLEPQPDDAVPRFQYEDHVKALVRDRIWPDSTRAVSQLRLTFEYQSASGWNRMFSPASSPSTSSITPANGCWTCRCCRRITPPSAATPWTWPATASAPITPATFWRWPRA